MKIIVAIKQVPERDAQVHIDATANWIDESDIHWALNESDAYALEEALQLKEKHGGEVVVVSAGPERVGSTIREALAKGADRAIHIDSDDLGQRDALGVGGDRRCDRGDCMPLLQHDVSGCAGDEGRWSAAAAGHCAVDGAGIAKGLSQLGCL